MELRLRPLTPLFVLFGILGLALAGCTGSGQPDELARAVAVGERPVAMKGSSPFFGGKIGVTVTISRGIGHGTGERGGAKAKIPDTFGWDKEDAAAYISSKNLIGSPLPPVTLRLRLQSLEQTSAVVEVDDFDSDMGNFAVYPAILALAPDQSAEVEPMISQLGVTSDEIPVKVTLRWGSKVESRTIMVRTVIATPAPAQ